MLLLRSSPSELKKSGPLLRSLIIRQQKKYFTSGTATTGSGRLTCMVYMHQRL
jgi:hypothetical protein